KRMAESVAARPLRDPRPQDRRAHRSLDRRLVEMMAPLFAGLAIGITACCRKDPLPTPLSTRCRVLPRQRTRQGHTSRTLGQICLVLAAHLLEMRTELGDCASGQGRAPVLAALAVSNRDLHAREVDVLHPQRQRLE